MYAPRDIRLGVQANGFAPPPGAPEAFRFVRQGLNGVAVFASELGDPVTKNARIYLYNPAAAVPWELLTNNGVGNWPCAIGYHGEVVWQEVARGVRRRAIAGGPIDENVAPYSSAGILDVLPDGSIWMDDGQPVTIRRPDQSLIVLPLGMKRQTADGWVYTGQASNTSGGIGCLAYRDWSDALLRVYSGDLQTPPRMDDDGLTVALTWDVPQGFIPASAWTLEPTSVPVPVTPIVVDPPLGVRYVGTWYPQAGAPGNIAVVDGSVIAWPSRARLGVLINLEYNRQVGVSVDDALRATHDEPRRFIYDTAPFDAHCRAVMRHGDIPMIECYPTATDTRDSFLRRMAPEVAKWPAGPLFLVCRAFQFPDADLHGWMAVYESALTDEHLIFFADDRADGLKARPLARADVQAFVASVTGAPMLPVHVPDPIPIPPIPPTLPGLAARRLLL